MTTEKPDYKIANDEAKALFESLGLTTQISSPLGDVKDGWPNILYTVTFSVAGKNLTTEYRLGTGHVQWKRALSPPSFSSKALSVDEGYALNTLIGNPSAQLKDKALHASTAAKLAIFQKVAPLPHEVLAAICDDSNSAHNESWDNYADNFGMDKDSIKGKAVYDFCCELYHKVTALIGPDNVAKLAELHSRF